MFVQREKYEYLPVKYDHDYAHAIQKVGLQENWKKHRNLVLVFYQFNPEILYNVLLAFLITLE